MQIVELPLDNLKEAPWNANEMDPAMLDHLAESISRYGMVQNLVVRPLSDGFYEVLSGNQRLRVLHDRGHAVVPCMVIDLDDARARLLAQALNRVHGEDDLGLKAELLREVIESMPQQEVLALLPETAESLAELASLGQESMAEYLQGWQKAQQARLKHLQVQLIPSQLEIVEEALARFIPMARKSLGDSPNAKGTALFLLCSEYLQQGETSS